MLPSKLEFSCLLRRDAFQFFVAADKVTAVRITDLPRDKRDVVAGKQKHIFGCIDPGCCNVFLAGHIVPAVEIHGKGGVRHIAHRGQFFYGQLLKVVGIDVFGKSGQTRFHKKDDARSQKEITIFLPDPRKLGDDFPRSQLTPSE